MLVYQRVFPTIPVSAGLSFNSSKIDVEVVTVGCAAVVAASGSGDPKWSAMKPANALAWHVMARIKPQRLAVLA